MRRLLTAALAAATLLAGSLAPPAAAVGLSAEVNQSSTRLSDATRSHTDGLAVVFDVPVEAQEVEAALSLWPGTEFRLMHVAGRIPEGRDPTQPRSSLWRGEAWLGLPPWPLAVGVMHQSVTWRWATDGAEEQIPFEAAGWGVGAETRMAVTPRLVVGAELRATPWARWTNDAMEALPPHRLFFLGYDVGARYFLTPNVATRVGYRWDALRAVFDDGRMVRDVAQSGLYWGLAVGF
ncbi:hypothetical protein [Limnochorda pilosa]|uniref:Outer membrane protein beta-barrel domain-containing protein n=1 Tax=Limnochorda pilosa TaxID=1555112 RepID=A0A0K2SNH3_LIMPI|nr:hypothetical protein [Limnochorda pilosa]BAS28673.1 hypothetical protein LIP_2844 [Limnochorda pilosa]